MYRLLCAGISLLSLCNQVWVRACPGATGCGYPTVFTAYECLTFHHRILTCQVWARGITKKKTPMPWTLTLSWLSVRFLDFVPVMGHPSSVQNLLWITIQLRSALPFSSIIDCRGKHQDNQGSLGSKWVNYLEGDFQSHIKCIKRQ